MKANKSINPSVEVLSVIHQLDIKSLDDVMDYATALKSIQNMELSHDHTVSPVEWNETPQAVKYMMAKLIEENEIHRVAYLSLLDSWGELKQQVIDSGVSIEIWPEARLHLLKIARSMNDHRRSVDADEVLGKIIMSTYGRQPVASKNLTKKGKSK